MDDGCCSYYNISCRFVSKSVFLGTPAADEIRHIQTPALASTPDALPGVQQPDMQGTAVEPVLRPVTREDRLAKVDRNHTEQKTGVDPLGIGNEINFQQEMEKTL